MRSIYIKRIVCTVCVSVSFVAALHFLSFIFMPKYVLRSREGNLISEYYKETDAGNGHQIIFLGDCEAYEGFVPPVLWERFGFVSYVRGSPQQLVWQSYALLCEMLEYERPSVVVFSVCSMRYGEAMNEAYNRMTLDGMKVSRYKILAVEHSLTDGESRLSYLFPVLRYHSRVGELGSEDIQYAFSRPSVSHNGYMMHGGVQMREDIAVVGEPDSPLPDICFEYLDKMRKLCDEHGVRLVLVKSPVNTWRYPWYEIWESSIREYSRLYELDYFNFIEDVGHGIDWSTDTYDGGAHLNVLGAEKLTEYFGRSLLECGYVRSLRGDKKVEDEWRRKLDAYYNERKIYCPK